MASTAISNLTAATTLGSADLLTIVQSGTNKKIAAGATLATLQGITLGTGVSTLLAGTPSGTGGIAGTTSPTFTTEITTADVRATGTIYNPSGPLYLTDNWGNSSQSALKIIGNGVGWGIGTPAGGSNIIGLQNNYFQLASASRLGFTSTGDAFNTLDTYFTRSAAGVFGANGLSISQYSTSTIAHTIQGIASRTAALTKYQTSAGGTLGNVSGGCIKDILSTVSTTTFDGSYNTLDTTTLVANALIANGDKVYFDYSLNTVSNSTATRGFKLAFATITILDTGELTFGTGAGVVRIYGYITRISATTCTAVISFQASGGASLTLTTAQIETTVPTSTLTGLTLTSTTTLVLSAAAGAGIGAAAGDISLVGGNIHIGGFGG